MGEKMKLTKHQKQIVKAIIKGTVYDIPSYLKEFQKWHLRKYDLTRPLAKFTEEEGGKRYKVIIDEDKVYIKGIAPMNMGIGTVNVDTKFPRKPEDIPDDAWEYREAELIRNVKPVEIDYNGEIFCFDFMEAGVNVADNFDDIVEFMSLWAYLRQESLVLEVPRDIVADDLGILFELKHREPKPETPFIIHRDKAPDSSIKPITRIIIDLDSIIALIISFLPIIQSLLPSNEPNYLAQISQQIEAIETLVESNQAVLDKLEVIKSTLEVVSASLDEINVNQQSEKINSLTAQIKQLSEWLNEHEDLVPSYE